MPPPDSRPVDSLATLAAEALAGTASGRVALIARRADPPAAALLRSRTATDLATHQLPLEPDELRLRLAAAGPFDLLVDEAGGPHLARRISATIWHLKEGGTLLARLPAAHTPAGRRALAFADTLRHGLGRPDEASPVRGMRWLKTRHRRTLLGGLQEVRVQDGYLLARLGTSALVKVPEKSADRLLILRPTSGQVLANVPANSWRSRAVVTASSPPPLNPLPTEYDAPAASLREYRDVVCLPGRAAYSAFGVHSESFRSSGRQPLRSPAFQEVAPHFVLRPEPPAAALDGDWYHLSNPLPGHFGHTLTEQVSHAWGWQAARERYPELRALVVTRPGKPVPSWELDLLSSCGIDRSQITVHEGSVRVERLVDATAMYDIGHYVHPSMLDTYAAMGTALAARSERPAFPTRLFHTRRHPKRRCRNQDEVEQVFADAGFEIVAPEDHPLPDQVAGVRDAQVVAGFAGSGLFHIALAGGPRHVITIGHEGYPAHNEYMMSALLGHRLDMVVCRPDVPRGPRFSRAAFHSDYVVDMQREGAFLREVLTSLDRSG